MIIPGVGISSDSGVVGRLVFRQQNFDISDLPESWGEFLSMKSFRGAGQSLSLTLEPGTQYSQYYVSFTDPYWRDRPIEFNLLGRSWERWRESYDEERLKGAFSFEQRLRNRWRRSLGFRAENVNVGNLDSDAPQEIRDVQGGNQLYGVRFGLGETTLDNRYLPSRGHVINSFYEQVTGDHAFGVLEGTYVRYFTLHEDVLERKTVLAGKVLGATVLGSAPPFEKFYAGGTGHYGMRGFEYRGVSTRGLQTNVPDPQLKDPIGSDWIFLANAEITVPLVGENFAGLFFVDSGTIDTGSYRVSIGMGIQIMVPQIFGNIPMRFEIATPLLRDDLDETQVFSFSGAGKF
jgi:outer membrane protein insertion porin family